MMLRKYWSIFLYFVAFGLVGLSCQTKPTVLRTEEPVLTTSKQADLANHLSDEDLVFVDVRNPLDTQLRSLRSAVKFWWRDFTVMKKNKREWVNSEVFSEYFILKRLTLSKKLVLLYDEKNQMNLEAAECIFRFFGFKTIYKEDIQKFRDLPSNVVSAYEVNISGASDWKAFRREPVSCEIK